MRDRAPLDKNSLTVLNHLEAYVNGDQPSDPSTVLDYIRFIEADRAVVSGSGDILDSAVLTSFIPLLSRILNSELYGDIYADLLRAMLEQLLFRDTLKFFPGEAVMAALKSPAYAVVFLAIHVLKLNLSRKDSDVVGFLLESGALQVITERVLTTPEIPTNIVSDVESSLQLFVQVGKFDLSAWQFLEVVHQSSLLENAVLLARYLSVIESFLLNASELSSDVIGQLSNFDMNSILNEDIDIADPFISSLLIAFYSTIVAKVSFSVLYNPIDQCVQSFVCRRQLHQHDFIVYPALSQLYTSLSLASKESKDYVKKKNQKHPILTQFDLSSIEDVKIFCRLNIEVIDDKSKFFDDNFANWSFQLASYPRFCCLIHLIDNPEFFELLIQSKKLEDAKLSTLPQNLIYELLEKLTKYDYSTEFLLKSLSFIMLTHLMTNDNSIVNPDIWQTKQQALQNLLLYRKVDLGVWHQGLTHCYKEMLHGRQVRSVEPKVDVTDVAM